MIGAIIGDIAGSYWEFRDEKVRDSEFFLPESTITDDTILTIATADAILTNAFYSGRYQEFTRIYEKYGYGPSFKSWAHTNSNYITENNSWGNGAPMRVSPVGWAFGTPQSVLIEAQQTACITHCHPSGIKAAQAVALAVYLARTGCPKDEIREVMESWFEYSTNMDLDDLHAEYTFDISSQGTLPPALSCVFQADDFETVIRNGLYVGGDTDTLLAIAGSIAEPLYGVPGDLREKAEKMVNQHSPKLLGIVKEFEKKYGAGKPAEKKMTAHLKELKLFFKRIGFYKLK